MPYGFQRITDLSSIGLKTLNDQLEMIWLKLMGGVDYNESSGELKNVVDTITDGNNVGTYLAQTNDGITLAKGAVGTNNLLRNGDAANGTKNWNIQNGTLSVVADTYEIYRQVFEIKGSGATAFTQTDIKCNPAVKHTFSFKGLLSYPAVSVTAYVRGKKAGTSEYYEHKQITVTPKANYADYYVSFETYTDENELEVVFSAQMATPYALFYVTDIQIKEGGALTAFVKNNEELKTNMFKIDDDGMTADVGGLQIEETDSNGETVFLIDGDTMGAAEINAPKISIMGRDILSEKNAIYVATNGSDANDGSEGSPLRTIQKAIKSVPLICDRTIDIYISQGTYYGNVCIYGQNILVNVHANNSLLIGNMEVCANGYICIENLMVQTTEAIPCVYAHGAGLTIVLRNCALDGVNKSNCGISCENGAKTYLDYTSFFNCNKAICINAVSNAFFFDNKGSNNDISLYCSGGIIMGAGTCPLADVMKSTMYCGQIFYDTNNMKSASNPFTSVSTYKWETNALDTATMLNGKFDIDNEKIVKGKGKKYIDAFSEKTDGPERSGFWFFDSASIVNTLSSKTVYGAEFTVKRAIYAGDPKPALAAFYFHDAADKYAPSANLSYTGVRTNIGWGQEESVFFPSGTIAALINGTYKGIAVKMRTSNEKVMAFCPQSEYTAKLVFYYR